MANLNDPDVRIQVLIRKDTKHGQFSDAIYLSPAEFEALKDEDLEALKDERVNKWLGVIEASKNATRPEPTKEDLEAEQSMLEAQKLALEVQAQAIEAQVTEISSKLAAREAKVVADAEAAVEVGGGK